MSAAEQALAQIPTVYATQDYVRRVEQAVSSNSVDTKSAIDDVKSRVNTMLDRQSDSSALIAGLKATIEALQGSVADLKRSVDRRQSMTDSERKAPAL